MRTDTHRFGLIVERYLLTMNTLVTSPSPSINQLFTPTIRICTQHVVFKEVVDSLTHVFYHKGYRVCHSNCIDEKTSDLQIIIMGKYEIILQRPVHYIVVQLEQSKVTHPNMGAAFTPHYISWLRNAREVWDYSKDNCKYLLSAFGIRFTRHIPFRFCPVLQQCRKLGERKKPIDVLFLGSVDSCDRRHQLLKSLSEICTLHCGTMDCWGETRADLISQSKIVLNIHFYDNAILETVRLSYLLSNQCFVISEGGREKEVRQEYQSYCKITPYNRIVETVRFYLENPSVRVREGKDFFNNWKQKPYINEFDFISQNVHNNTIETGTRRKRRKRKKHSGKIHYYLPCTIEYVEHSIENGGCRVVLPHISDEDLPCVSVLTPTKDRGHLFQIAVHNFVHFLYPRHKLEWVIVNNGRDSVESLLPTNANIKYIELDPDQSYTIGRLRNMCVEEATHDILVHMDDDDYYPDSSIIARVKALQKYSSQKVGCVGCVSVGCYDLLTSRSTTASDGPRSLVEASMAYTRSFWSKQSFNDMDTKGENNYFLQYRHSKVRAIPFQFVLVALTHTCNITGNLRRKRLTHGEKVKLEAKSGKKIQQNFSYEQLFTEEFQNVIDNILQQFV